MPATAPKPSWAQLKGLWPRVEHTQIRCLAGTFGLSRSHCPYNFREFGYHRADRAGRAGVVAEKTSSQVETLA